MTCSPHVKNNIDMPHIDLGNMTVPISNAAKNIDVLFDISVPYIVLYLA